MRTTQMLFPVVAASFHFHLKKNEIVATFRKKSEFRAAWATVRPLAGGDEDITATGAGVTYRGYVDYQFGTANQLFF